MKVLVACEISGIVRDAFIAEGHDAISCDLLPTERPGPHIIGDVTPWFREEWDLVIAHPPCTELTAARGAIKPGRLNAIGQSILFFKECIASNAPRVAVENPAHMYKFIRRLYWGEPDCVVEPYHFGDPFKKRTGFWLRNLPPLLPVMEMGMRYQVICPSNSGTRRGVAKTPKERSRFHPGMAAAMAKQWGSL